MVSFNHYREHKSAHIQRKSNTIFQCLLKTDSGKEHKWLLNIRGKVDGENNFHVVPKYHSMNYCDKPWKGGNIFTVETIDSCHLNQVIQHY